MEGCVASGRTNPGRVTGSDFMGEVVAVGDNVQNINFGDRVIAKAGSEPTVGFLDVLPRGWNREMCGMQLNPRWQINPDS